MSSTPYPLGRIEEPKPEQANYLLSSLMEAVDLEEELPDKRYWRSTVNLNQGATGTCVGHGFAHRMEDYPIPRPNLQVDPFEIYRRACHLDPWDDNDNEDLNYGTSVDAGARACRQMGLIDAFYWAWDVETAKHFILLQGPLVIGIGWPEDFFDPQPEYYADGRTRMTLNPGGPIAGGHCVEVRAYNSIADVFVIKNSWGLQWGANGQACIRGTVMKGLMDEGGEFCWPQEVRL